MTANPSIWLPRCFRAFGPSRADLRAPSPAYRRPDGNLLTGSPGGRRIPIPKAERRACSGVGGLHECSGGDNRLLCRKRARLERPDDLRVARIVERCELLGRQSPELHIRFPRPCNGSGDEPLARDVRKDAPADARSFRRPWPLPSGRVTAQPGDGVRGRRSAKPGQNAEYRAPSRRRANRGGRFDPRRGPPRSPGRG